MPEKNRSSISRIGIDTGPSKINLILGAEATRTVRWNFTQFTNR